MTIVKRKFTGHQQHETRGSYRTQLKAAVATAEVRFNRRSKHFRFVVNKVALGKFLAK